MGQHWLQPYKIQKQEKPVIKTRNLLKVLREQALVELLAWLEEKRREFGYKITHGSN